MRKLATLLIGITLLLATAQSSAVPYERDFFDRDRFDRDFYFRARLSGFQEVPTLSSPAKGEFVARLNNREIAYRLTYFNLSTPVLFAHIHLGASGVNGGVAAFLCGGAPPQSNKAPCPQEQGIVTGTIQASDVIGPLGQGISAGEFAEVIRAMRNSVIYANVHTEQYPAGEIRGQVLTDDD